MRGTLSERAHAMADRGARLKVDVTHRFRPQGGCQTSLTHAAMRSKSFSQDHTGVWHSCDSTSVLPAAKPCRVAHVPSKPVVVSTSNGHRGTGYRVFRSEVSIRGGASYSDGMTSSAVTRKCSAGRQKCGEAWTSRGGPFHTLIRALGAALHGCLPLLTSARRPAPSGTTMVSSGPTYHGQLGTDIPWPLSSECQETSLRLL